jgi:uncharacterized protein (DUF2062 family)
MKKYATKIIEPLLKFLRQGMSPQKLALTLAFGITLGIFPIIGTTTGICILAAFLFRLNLAALQLINYIVYPVQIICVIPFYKSGAILFQDKAFTMDLTMLKNRISENLSGTVIELWSATWHAAATWLIISPMLLILIYQISHPILKKIAADKNKS